MLPTYMCINHKYLPASSLKLKFWPTSKSEKKSAPIEMVFRTTHLMPVPVTMGVIIKKGNNCEGVLELT